MRSKSRFTTLVLLETRESYLQIRVQSLCTLRGHCRQGPRNIRYQAGATARESTAPSAKRPALPERETVRNEVSGDGERSALGSFQRDLLGQHDVSARQLAQRQETQPKLRAAFSVDLADIRHCARIDPILPAGLATDDL